MKCRDAVDLVHAFDTEDDIRFTSVGGDVRHHGFGTTEGASADTLYFVGVTAWSESQIDVAGVAARYGSNQYPIPHQLDGVISVSVPTQGHLTSVTISSDAEPGHRRTGKRLNGQSSGAHEHAVGTDSYHVSIAGDQRKFNQGIPILAGARKDKGVAVAGDLVARKVRTVKAGSGEIVNDHVGVIPSDGSWITGVNPVIGSFGGLIFPPAVKGHGTVTGTRAESVIDRRIGTGGEGLVIDRIGTVEHLDGDEALISCGDSGAARIREAIRVETIDGSIDVVIDAIVTDLRSGNLHVDGEGSDTSAGSKPIRADTDPVSHSGADTQELDVAVEALASGENTGISVTGEFGHRAAIVGRILVDQQVGVPSERITGVNLCDHVLVRDETEPYIVFELTHDSAGNAWERISTESGAR